MDTTDSPATWQPVSDKGRVGCMAARETDEASLQFRLIAERARSEWFADPSIRQAFPVIEEYIVDYWDQFTGNVGHNHRRRTQMTDPKAGEHYRVVRLSNHGRAA